MKPLILLIVFSTSAFGVIKKNFKPLTLAKSKELTVSIQKHKDKIEYLPIAIFRVPIDCRHSFYLCLPVKKAIWPLAEPYKPLNIRKTK